MLQVEQLHEKRDKAASCLASRKRKLTDLYWATLEDQEQQQNAYNKQLQAFLDANDLQKGRQFDESTLPLRRSTRQRTHVEALTHIHENSTLPPSKTIRQSRTSTPKSPHTTSTLIQNDTTPSPEQYVNGHSLSPDAESKEDREDSENISQPVRTPKDARRRHASPLKIKEVDLVDASSASAAKPDPQLSDGMPESAQGLETISEEAASAAQSVNDTAFRPRSPAQHPTPTHLTIPNSTRRSKSPISLPPVATNVDPQSSPTSANGVTSHDTPAVTADSPSTSPGAEEVPGPPEDFQKPKPSDDLTPPDSTDNNMSVDSTLEDASGDKRPANGLAYSTAMDVDAIEKPESSTVTEKPSRDPEFKRPSMRIDTQSSISSFGPESRTNSALVESPGQMTGASTPRKTPMASYISQDQPKRATRISSGALGRKSVSEILGETPKPMSPQIDRSTLMTPSSASRDDFMQNTSALRLAERERREKDRERSKLSTVVFAKPLQLSDEADTTELAQRSPIQGLGSPKERDYLYTLFESRAYNSRTGHTLNHLLGSAHKTLSTADHLVEYQEAMDCRTLKRIYQLQNANRWPLRQIKRADEPPRPTSSWDFLLDHAKWLRTDFREERKWKMAASAGVAQWCAEWVASDSDERKALQVRVKPHRDIQTSDDSMMHDEPGPALELSHSPPELVPSHEEESVSDGGLPDPRDAMAVEPAAIFSLGPNDFNFTFHKTPAAEKLLNELPLYEPAEIVPDLSKSDLAEKRDALWEKDLCAISKFAEGKIKIRQRKPPTKSSRYDYDVDDLPRKESVPLPPEQTNVALFMPENKHTRDRIHPGHSFRPPSEHPMPSQAFFESRSSSQWTQSEDDELRKLVKDYSYNWSLIASCLAPKSLFFSGADRRTPWECFERWTGLEGLPAEMQKTPYFRAYHGRIENAARHSAAQYEAAQRQAGNNQIPPRRRTTLPVRVERKRTQRYLAMLDAMRKLAKKRETAVQKQQHAADLAATRKMTESNQPKPPFSTPAQFSQLKHERELRSAERAEQYRQQVFAQRQFAAQQARQAGGQVNGVPNVPRIPGPMPNGLPGTNAVPNMPNGNVPGLPNGQGRPNTGMPAGPNAMAQLPPHMRGGAGAQLSPAQMQAQLVQAQQRLVGQNHSPEQLRVHTEAIKAQQQQLLLARQAQAQQGGNHSSPNLPNAAMANGNGSQAAYMAALASANGMPSPSVQMNGSGSSPRANSANMGGQPLSSGPIPVIQQLIAKIRQENPNMSGEEAQQMATQQMMTVQASYQAQTQKRNQAALNAAMGSQNAANAAAYAAAAAAQGQAPMMSNEAVQAYNQRMRQVQQAQAAQHRHNVGMAAGMGPNAMMAGMTGSPILNMARPVSQHGQMSRSATPRERSGSHNGMVGPGQGSPRNGQIQMQS